MNYMKRPWTQCVLPKFSGYPRYWTQGILMLCNGYIIIHCNVSAHLWVRSVLSYMFFVQCTIDELRDRECRNDSHPHVCISFIHSLFSNWEFTVQYIILNIYLTGTWFVLKFTHDIAFQCCFSSFTSADSWRSWGDMGQCLWSWVTVNKGDSAALIDVIVAQVLMMQNQFSGIELRWETNRDQCAARSQCDVGSLFVC